MLLDQQKSVTLSFFYTFVSHVKTLFMNKISLLLVSCFITFATFGQAKKITLEDGVLQQNRLFRADKLLGFQWIPNTNKYIFFAEGGK
mgnify:FL=1